LQSRTVEVLLLLMLLALALLLPLSESIKLHQLPPALRSTTQQPVEQQGFAGSHICRQSRGWTTASGVLDYYSCSTTC
jgi:hypothetical protein